MIQLEKISKRFGEKILFEHISYKFPTDKKIALIGANGAGKSTLFSIICGVDTADYGDVLIPKKTRIGFLPQEPNPEPLPSVEEEMLSGHKELYELHVAIEDSLKKLHDDPENEDVALAHADLEVRFGQLDGYRWESKAKRILYGLGFDEEKQKKSPLELSGGWRMRLELGKLFLSEPSLLLLDEPTNHLDLPSLMWVESYLEKYPGTVVLISHDRDLLNRFAEYTVLLEEGELKEFAGNFDRFTELYQQEQEQKAALAANIAQKKTQLMRFVERFGTKASKAKQAQSKLKQVAKLEQQEKNIKQVESNNQSMSLKLTLSQKSGKVVLTTKALSFGYPDQTLFEDLNMVCERGQRIAILGANGVGKTTLLKTLVGKLTPKNGNFEWGYQTDISYFAQDQVDELDEKKTIFENLMASSEIGDKEARSILGALLFSGDDIFKPVRVLSGGEKNRVGLACVLASKANILILDEPTNHLDMTSVEVLLEALSLYEGTIIFVSHNRSFVDRLATHVLPLRQGTQAHLTEGKTDDVIGFLMPEDDDAKGNSTKKISKLSEEIKPNTAQAVDEQTIKEWRKSKQKLTKNLPKLEREISSLKDAIKNCEVEMAAASEASDFGKLQEIQAHSAEKQAKLDGLEEEWLFASEELEEISQKLEKVGRN